MRTEIDGKGYLLADGENMPFPNPDLWAHVVRYLKTVVLCEEM